MKDWCYVTVNRNGIVKLNKQAIPQVANGERFFKLKVEVDDAWFSPRAIPEIDLIVGNPYDIGAPEISVSEVQAEIKGLSETWQAQRKVNAAAARLLEIGIQSGDEVTQRSAISILQDLKDQGISVNVVVPGEDEDER